MSKECQKLHIALNNLPRYSFPLEKHKIYKNGIYILFENGEKAHGVDRIVRIGTHTGQNNLFKRLKEHFVKENKDRSIFRKNIGRAMLNQTKDKYLDVWEIDFQKRINKEIYKDKIIIEKQKLIEKDISSYIQNNLSFVIIEILDKDQRLYYESKLISTVSLCKDCFCSENWLGKYSTKDKIRTSSLWLVNQLYKEPFSEKELDQFINDFIKK